MENPYSKLSYNNENHDDQIELNEFHKIIDERIAKQTMPEFLKFEEFLDNDVYKRSKGDQDMNLFEQGGKFRLLHIPNKDAEIWFSYYDKCRKAGVEQNWTEKQNPLKSGIRLDFDIYQTTPDRIVGKKHMYNLAMEISKALKEVFPIPHGFKVYNIISIRKVVSWDETRGKYKDGFHIDLPSIQCARDHKRLFIWFLKNSKIMTTIFAKDFTEVDVEEFVDVASVYVPLVLYGSCKDGSRPYDIHHVWVHTYDSDGSIMSEEDTFFAKSEQHINIPWEMSVNFDSRIIKKQLFEPHKKWDDQLFSLSKKNQGIKEEEKMEILSDLSLLTINDPDANYIKTLLELLKPQRYNNRKLWFKVVYALVNKSESYIPLARWFSRKSIKFNEHEFQKTVHETLTGTRYKLTIESIAYWASKDNPDKFQSANEVSCFNVMVKLLFDKITEGKLGNAHYAEMLHLFLQNKYVTDFKGNRRVWYEFKFPHDKHEPGQVYKWIEIQSPDSLDIYLHRKLHNLCLKVVTYVEKKISETVDKNQMKYLSKILSNFKASARGLTNDGTKASILKQGEKLFNTPGFAKTLDKDPMALGVGNGVLLLSYDGKPPLLLKSFHNYKLSRYTDTPYFPIDPNDPVTIKILKALRAMHPDDETDAFEYKCAFKAASIDNRPRETIMLLITGPGSNGKSFEFGFHHGMLGDMYCCAMPFTTLTQSKEGSPEGASPFLMQLETVRACVYSEGPVCAVLYMPIVKRITGGDPLPIRQLHGQAQNVRSRCYHMVLSNHDFIITSHEEATWRRLRYLWLPMIFKDDLEYEKDNKYHRLMDRSLNAEFTENLENRGKMLSINVFFHMKLMKKFGGVVDHVPHPTVDKQTLDFRNRQDTVNRFITERVIVSPECRQQTSIEDVIEKYVGWYNANIKDVKHFKQEIKNQFIESVLKDSIEQTSHGTHLKDGFRVLGTGEELMEGESQFRKELTRKTRVKKYEYEFPNETPEEYIGRFKKEYDELFGDVGQSPLINLTNSYSYDSDNEEDDIDADDFRKDEEKTLDDTAAKYLPEVMDPNLMGPSEDDYKNSDHDDDDDIVGRRSGANIRTSLASMPEITEADMVEVNMDLVKAFDNCIF